MNSNLFFKTFFEASKEIYSHFSEIASYELGATNETENDSGDSQKGMDLLSNEILKNYFTEKKDELDIYGIMSEEDKEMIVLNQNGSYVVAFDPLDGSTNIASNLSCGSILGIYKLNKKEDGSLFSGEDIMYAGYSLYSQALQIVWAAEDEVKLYQVDKGGELVHPLDLKNYGLSKQKFGCISGDSLTDFDQFWLICHLKLNSGDTISNYKNRWSGCMVADVHRIVLSGGYFCYPGSSKIPSGKLRIWYECVPMGFIIKKMGGRVVYGNDFIGYKIEKEFLLKDNYHLKYPVLIIRN